MIPRPTTARRSAPSRRPPPWSGRRACLAARAVAVAVPVVLAVLAGLVVDAASTPAAATAGTTTTITTSLTAHGEDLPDGNRRDGSERAPRNRPLRDFARAPERPEPLFAGPLAVELTPKQQKKLDKLATKHAKVTLKLADKQADLSAAQADLLAAQAALVAAQALPYTTIWEWLDRKQAIKLATKQLKKAQKQVAKLEKKVGKLQAKQAKLVEKIEEIDPTYFSSDGGDDGSGGDGGGGGDGGDGGGTPAEAVTVPILIQEALPAGGEGVDRPGAVATFGLPFAQGEVVLQGGRPGLAVSGGDAWQFRTLETWPDGSVRWALCDVQTDVTAGALTVGLDVVGGSGASSGPALATDTSSAVLLDTGPLQASIRKSGFNLFADVTVDGFTMVDSPNADGLYAVTTDGALATPGPDTVVTIEENGPVRAVVRADGTLSTAGGADVIDFTCRITARRGSRELEVTATVRNASIERPAHAVIEGLELAVRSVLGSGKQAVVARHDGTGQELVTLGKNDDVYFYQAYTSAPTADITSSDYLPPIPKVEGSDTELVENGYRITLNGDDLLSFPDKQAWPAHGFLQARGANGGVTVSIRDMPYEWPAALEASGDGTVVAGLFTTRNSVPYTFVWRQYESRTALFSFHKNAAAPDPEEVARRLDYPVVGRAADYDQYDASGVFPYRLVTIAEQEQAYDLMGVPHSPQTENPVLSVRRYLAKSTTGGSNNFPKIEDELAGDWLRHGRGGHYLDGLDLALYKCEWQIPHSDDFDHADDPGPSNDALPHTDRTFGDEEHRYRDGMILAWHLTGDSRIYEALQDEVEVLLQLNNYSQPRSMYQSLRAQALLTEFLDDDDLRAVLENRVDYFTTPIIDIETATSGWGWDGLPGQGPRGYFAWANDLQNEKPPGENFQARGFFNATLGPVGLYHAARVLDLATPLGQAAHGRMVDLAHWTRDELFPDFAAPVDRHLAYSYAMTLQEVTVPEAYDFHPILFGMAEAFLDTGDPAYLQKGVEQIEAFAVHDDGPFTNNLHYLDTRLACQHFFAIYRDWKLGNPLP